MMLSLFYSFNLEKSIPIEFEKLEITPSSITINEKCYKLGQIQDISSFDGIEEEEANLIQESNSKGGVGWRSLRGAVEETGDVILRNQDESFLEFEKQEILAGIRRFYLTKLEIFIQHHPLFLQMEDALDVDKIQREHYVGCWTYRMITQNFGGQEIAKLADFPNAMKRMNPVRLERDELAQECPVAFQKILDCIEQLRIRGKPENANFLMRLAYPQIIYPHFNQLTVFDKDGTQEYNNRLPNGLPLRQAFKQFLTRLFEGRNKIGARHFIFTGNGIIPLPVGFQIEHVEVIDKDNEISSNGLLLNAYNSKIRSVDAMNMVIINTSPLEGPLIKSCPMLEIKYHGIRTSFEVFSELSNNVLCLTLRAREVTPVEVINHWLNNENRKIGTKFFIANFDSSSILSPKLLEIGFKQKSGSDSYHRVLSGSKIAVLDVARERPSVTPNFWDGISMDGCFCLEISNNFCN